MKNIILLFASICLLGCNIPNQEKSVKYVKDIAEGNYEKVLEETDNLLFKITPKDSFLIFSRKLNKSINNCFDDKSKIYLLSSEIKTKGEATANQIATVEICNDKDFVDIQLHFNLDTGKVTGVYVSDIYKVPSKTRYWISFAIGFIICIFVIYTIVRIKKSNMKKKWIKYLFVVFFNFPTLIITPINTHLKILKFQLFGFGLTAPNTHYTVEIALPIVSIIMLIIMSYGKKKNELMDNVNYY